MDRVKKFLQKLSPDRQVEIDRVLAKIEYGEIQNLDVKKLKGHGNLFRVRVGDIRIVFSQEKESINVVFVGRRGDSQYERL